MKQRCGCQEHNFHMYLNHVLDNDNDPQLAVDVTAAKCWVLLQRRVHQTQQNATKMTRLRVSISRLSWF